MSFVRRLVIFLSVTAVSIAFDQATKQVATAALKGQPIRSFLGDTFRLQFATNQGAFLSLGASLPEGARHVLLTVGVGLLLLGLSLFALLSQKVDGVQVGAYALIASGGFSNWVDRARFDGSVVDFMNMGIGPLRTGVFNVADLAILAGIGVLFWHGRREERRLQQARQAEKPAPDAPPPA